MNRVPEDNRAAEGPAPGSVRGALLPLVLAGCYLSMQPPTPSLQAPESVLEANARSDAGGRLNVLFLCVDDLRPELGSFGVSYAPTPHLDRLAQQACRIRAVSSRHA